EWDKLLTAPSVSTSVSISREQAWRKACVQSGVLFTRGQATRSPKTLLLLERRDVEAPAPSEPPPRDEEQRMEDRDEPVPPPLAPAVDELAVPPPAGAVCIGDTWQQLAPSSAGQLGCYAFVGPEQVIKEGKDN